MPQTCTPSSHCSLEREGGVYRDSVTFGAVSRPGADAGAAWSRLHNGPASCQSPAELGFSLRSQETRFKNKQPTWAYSALSFPSCVEISGPGALLSQQHREGCGRVPPPPRLRVPGWVQAEKRGWAPHAERSPAGGREQERGPCPKTELTCFANSTAGRARCPPERGCPLQSDL